MRTLWGLQRRRRAATVRSHETRQFDQVAAELGRTRDSFKVPERKKGEVLAAFAAHKNEVTEGYSS